MTVIAPASVTAVIFDVGGVLAHPAAGQFEASFFGSRDADSDHPWHRLERGELTMAQALPLLDMPPGPPKPPKPYVLDEDWLELAEQLAEAGYRLALCTNTPREAAPLWQALYPWADVFDVIVRSCDIGARKPDPRMVATALERLGSPAAETLFVDDLPANRDAAVPLGVTPIAAGDPEAIATVRALTGVARDAPRVQIGPRGPRRPPVSSPADQLLVDVLFDPDHRADPFPLLAELRRTSPIHQLGEHPIWYATRYADCRQVLVDPGFVKVTEYLALDFVTGDPVPPPPAGMVLPLAFVDPPEHTPIRKVMNTGFTRRRMDGLGEWLHELATDIVGEALRSDPLDVVEGISYPLAMRVICDLVGVPPEERNNFRGLMKDASVIFEPGLPPERIFEAVSAIVTMTGYFTELADARPGLLRDLLGEARGAEGVTPDDVIANVTFLFFAGFETVAHLISTTLHMMSRHPDQFARIVADPSLAMAAASEVARFHSPVQTNSRIARAELDLGGVTIPPGGVVVTMLGAANRDPEAYPDPDRFDITRGGPAPLAFGTGIHYCLGARLALLEAATVLRCLVEAGVRELRPRHDDWKHAIVLRGFEELELDVTRGG